MYSKDIFLMKFSLHYGMPTRKVGWLQDSVGITKSYVNCHCFNVDYWKKYAQNLYVLLGALNMSKV